MPSITRVTITANGVTKTYTTADTDEGQGYLPLGGWGYLTNLFPLVEDQMALATMFGAIVTDTGRLTPTEITLGGVTRATWPTSTGSAGTVAMSGQVTLGGAGGVTVVHNLGTTSYLVKVLPTGADPGRVGEISYVKSANTVVIYNSGEANLTADFELSMTA